MRPSKAFVFGGLTVGTLDILDAFTFFGIRNGVAPSRILQSIAAGLLGRASFQGGAATAALGLVLHFLIAFGIVGTYFVVARAVPALTRRPFLTGPLYGLVAVRSDELRRDSAFSRGIRRHTARARVVERSVDPCLRRRAARGALRPRGVWTRVVSRLRSRVNNRRATPRPGMQRRPNVTGLQRRDTMAGSFLRAAGRAQALQQTTMTIETVSNPPARRKVA